jgi:hypothetical protein
MKAKPEAKAEKTFRSREHRYSKLPVKDLLRTRMDELNIKNIDMQQRLGYPTPNVIAMMKMGGMRMAANKAYDLAQMLQLDPAFILGKMLNENDPQLWDTIQKIIGNKIVSEAEFNTAAFLRAELDGFDIDLSKNAEFVAAVTPVLAKLRSKESKELKLHIAKLDEHKAVKAAA